MADRDDGHHYFTDDHDADGAMAALEVEQRRLGELDRVWKDETTTVRSRDQSFSMTFDGRGDLSDVSFHGTRYRTLAPAELAHLIVTTVAAGRLQSVEKMAATMSGSLPGVDFVALATGKVEPRAVLDALIKPVFDRIGRPAGPAAPVASRPDWES